MSVIDFSAFRDAPKPVRLHIARVLMLVEAAKKLGIEDIDVSPFFTTGSVAESEDDSGEAHSATEGSGDNHAAWTAGRNPLS